MAEEMVAGVRRGGEVTGDSKLAMISDKSFLCMRSFYLDWF